MSGAVVGGQVVHVVGARPNFVKAAPVVRALADRGRAQRIVHTGQHYDRAMSEVFFTQLGLPEPDRNLGVGSGTHAGQTAALLIGLEMELTSVDPAMVVVYGDVNSTLAAALVAAKLMLPIAHVEAGLRSFDRSMPEEVNRVVVDRLAGVLFATSPEAMAHLAAEGIAAGAMHLVGNPMIDTLMAHLDRLDPAAVRTQLGLANDYAVVTLHRPANVDDPATAATIVDALAKLATMLPVVLPMHPRSRASLHAAGIDDANGVQIVDPLGYVEFLSLVRGARLVLTDSGGLQEETTMLDVPCLTIRPNTERPITITHGTNRLVRADEVAARAADILDGRAVPSRRRPPLWDGHAGERIAEVIAGHMRD